MLLPEGQQLAGAGGIVHAVEINCGTRLEPLEPPRPAHHRDATSDSRVINGKPTFREQARRRQRGDGVAHLEAPRQRQLDLHAPGGMGSANHSAIAACGDSVRSGYRAQTLNAVGGVHFHQPRVHLCAASRNYRAGLGPLGRANHPAARLDDARFFGGDLLDRVTKEILVVEINLRDDSNLGLHDIGRVEAPAHTHLEDDAVRLAPPEPFHGHRGQALEVGGVRGQCARSQQSFDEGVEAGEALGELVIGDVFAVQAQPLVDAFEVRRSVEARAQPGRAKDALHHCGRRAFAVGAGDVHRGISVVWIAQALGEHGDFAQVELRCARLLRGGQLPPQRQQVTDGIFVRHARPETSRARWRCRPSGLCAGRRHRESRAAAGTRRSENPPAASGEWSAR